MEIRVASTERALIDALQGILTGCPSSEFSEFDFDKAATPEAAYLRDKFAAIELSESALDVGDVWILDKTQPEHPCFVVERKTLDDLNASIMDGRYREQAIRLHSSNVVRGSPRQVIYLLECDPRRWTTMRDEDQLKWNRVRASLMIAPGHDFLLLESQSVRDSAFKLLSFAMRANELLVAGGRPTGTPAAGLFFSPAAASELGWTPLDEEEVRHRVLETQVVACKRQFNVVPEHFLPMVLGLVPGVGIEIATCISARFGGALATLLAFLSDESRAADDLLEDLASVCTASSGRRIGVAVARAVAKYLCPQRFYPEFAATAAAAATAKRVVGAKRRRPGQARK